MTFQYISRVIYNLDNMPIGDDWREYIPIFQQGGNTAWDFVGWKASAEVRHPTTKDLIAFFSTELSSPTIEFADDGMYLIKSAAETAELEAGGYVWSCRFIDDGDLLRSQILTSRFQIVEVTEGNE